MEVDVVFLLVTGDTAYSGAKAEYQIATDFFNTLQIRLKEYSGKPTHIIVLPGNHDCDFSNKENKARDSMVGLIQDKGEAVLDKSVLDLVTTVQTEYFEYAKQFNSTASLVKDEKLLQVFHYEIGGKSLIINCYNTAFISQLNEAPGKMMMPVGLFPNKGTTEKADLVLSCFHHPLHWLNPDNRRVFKDYIERQSDMYFTGHEHESTKTVLNDLEANTVYYIEGDVLQDSWNSNNSGFNLITLDWHENLFKIENYKWKTDKYTNQSPAAKWTAIERSLSKVKNPFELKKEFRKQLSDAGANFSHPRVSSISLEDIFIFPTLDLLDFTNTKDKETLYRPIDSESIIKSLKHNIRIILQGPENIGKTALARVIYSHLHAKGMVPILIPGHRIKNTGLEDFQKMLLNLFHEQYDTKDDEFFLQLDKSKLVLIIDDFHRINLASVKFKGRMVANLVGFYENIILAGNELMTLEDIILDEGVPQDLFSSFSLYEIKEFGNTLRNRLINKWLLLGPQETMPDQERIAKLSQAESVLNTVTGKNIVPSYPIFLLTILQAIEMGNPTDLAASTFGHYYQFLIQKAFSSTIRKQDEITSYHNYLSELAFYLFKNKTRTLDIAELKSFDLEYRSQFTIHTRIEDIIKNLIDAHIIHAYDNQYEFKYLYIYYFFISKYLSDNLDQPEIKVTISSLCKRNYRAEFANILLFLTHHSKDKFLLEEILTNARSILQSLVACKLEGDIEAINRLGGKLPKMVYNVKSVDEHRNALNEKKDKDERGELIKLNQELSTIPDLNEDVSEIDILALMNQGFKTIEILGQILKNNYGKLSNSTLFQLVEETYLLGLRMLKVFFSIIEENTEFFTNSLSTFIADKKINDPNRIESLAKQFLFRICGQISYGYVKKVSDSLGTEKLENIYSQVLAKHQYNSAKLIDFSIKLDHYTSFPNSDMRKLKTQFEKYPLPFLVMKNLVINHLYLFPVPLHQSQRICEFLDIPMNFQRSIKQTSNQKKK